MRFWKLNAYTLWIHLTKLHDIDTYTAYNKCYNHICSIGFSFVTNFLSWAKH